MYEQMLSKDNSELESDIADMRNEILKIQAERRDQQQRYTERLQSKDQTIQCKFYRQVMVFRVGFGE